MEVELTEEELAERRRNWQPPQPRVEKGYLARYARLVSSASRGAILDEALQVEQRRSALEWDLMEVDELGIKVSKNTNTAFDRGPDLAQSLLREGVEVVIGIPRAVLPIYDELYRMPAIKHF